MRIKDLPEEEKPREKAQKIGIENLSNVELLSILLRTGTKNSSVKELSIEILNEIKDIHKLTNMRIPALTKIKGIGKTKAITLLSAVELGKRVLSENKNSSLKIKNTKDIYNAYQGMFQKETQEKFYVLFLNPKNEVINEKLIFIGTANQTLIHPRDIYKEAILNNATKIICIHNHPSGDVTPSKEDVRATLRMKDVGNLVGIPLLDHVILGSNSYYSFLEGGYL